MSTSVRANANAPNASSSAKSPNPATAVVLTQVHVSCFITAANRATPVFEVAPERHCVRVVNKPLGDPSAALTSSTGQSNASGVGSANGGSTSGGATRVPSAEWDFHTLFASSSSHAVDFYREITQPAFRNVCDGWNTNIVAWGVHPTQKYRLLFGKSTSSNNSFSIQPHQQNQAQVSEKEVLELYGQLGGLLHEFFNSSSRPNSVRLQHQHSSMASQGWRIGISSWIVVSNQVIDLLKPAMSPPSPSSSNARKVTSATTASSPLSFVSLEAKSFVSACRILQTAKTNRIVMKQNAEHAHFFLRLAFFHNGQVSTMHFVDLIDLKDFKEDQTSIQEKQELFDILHEIRQSPMSPRYSTIPPTVAQGLNSRPGATNSGSTGSMSGSSTPKYKTRKMVLSNFILPLLIANAKTFLYANVIDSRTSLRESVQLLNAVANAKGFSCTCKRLCGVEFIQLGFQIPPDDDFLRQSHTPDDEESKQNLSAQDAAAKALAVVAVGESLLSRLASSSSSLSSPLSNSASFGSISALLPAASFLMSTAAPPFSAPNLSLILASGSSPPLASPSVSNSHHQHPGHPSQRKDSFSSVPMESETLSWLESFSQRKRDILGGKIDTIAPLPVYHTSQDKGTPSAPAKSTFFNSSEGDGNDKGPFKPSRGVTFSSLDTPKTEFGFEATQMESPSTRDMVQQTSADLLQRLRAAMGSAEKSRIRRASSEPLPITDADDDTGAHSTTNSRGAAASTTASTLLSTMDTSEGRVTNLEDDRDRWSAQTPSSSQLTARYNQRNTPGLAHPTPVTAPVLQSQPSPPLRAPTTNRMGSSNIQIDDAFASNRTDCWATTSSNTVQPLDFDSVTTASKSVSFSRPPTVTPQHDAAAVPRPSPLYHQQDQGKILHETLERANVPSQAMAPANLDGLDAVTVTKIQATEAALLRKNYDALLTIVQEQ